MTGYPSAAAAGDDLVATRLEADAQRPAVSELDDDVERRADPPEPAGIDDRG